jgi:copper chaperone CopZ
MKCEQKMMGHFIGEKMTNERSTLKTSKIDCTGCKTCTNYQADNLKHAIARLIGISEVKVDGVTGKVVLEYDDKRISLAKVIGRIQKLGYHVEVLSTEKIR